VEKEEMVIEGEREMMIVVILTVIPGIQMRTLKKKLNKKRNKD